MTNNEDAPSSSSSETTGPVSSIKEPEREPSGSNSTPPKSLSGGEEVPTPPQLATPFTTICGEKVIHLGQSSEGTFVITNYRLYIQIKTTNFNIPLGLIDQVEGRDLTFLHVHCKDARYVKCTFSSNEILCDVLKKLQQAISFPKSIEESFAFTFYDRTEKELTDEMKFQLGADSETLNSESYETAKERFDAEIKRMEFNVELVWRVSDENKEYELCSSYPQNIIVPMIIDKKKLEQVACFRSARRFPAVVWRHRGNGAVICRCSQPEVGWFGWRSTEDEDLVQHIIQACGFDRSNNVGESSHTVELDSTLSSGSSNNSIPNGSIEYVLESPNVKKLLILDARSYPTAFVNRARGGGCECLEYYPNCEIQFMNLANIHSIRKSFANVRHLCTLPSEQANWYSQLENCKWLQHMSGLMKAAVTVVTAVENNGRPVMVHCSDGWDRTPQIVSLAEILLDPYYRSLKGFQVLVEREWLDYGHKFGDRCGQGVGSEDTNERCPVFLQWLDCLHQLVRQFPTTFEFNLTFLVKLAQHTYSNLFGTFLCNTAKEREQYDIENKAHSVWRFLQSTANHDKFRNSLYTNSDNVVWPSCEVRDLVLWSQMYLGYENPPPFLTEVVNPSQENSPTPSVTAESETSERIASCKTLETGTKTRSCENLANLNSSKGLQRKMSDSSFQGSFHGTEDMDISQNKENAFYNTFAEDLASGPATEAHKGIFIDSENEDDTEPNSEGRSESTIINTHKHKINIKSIESSTDTLVAELGVLFEPKSPKAEVHTNTGPEAKSTNPIPMQTNVQSDNGLSLNELHSDYNNGLQHNFNLLEYREGITKDDLAQLANSYNQSTNMTLEPTTTNHCEVCATSRKLVRDIDVTYGASISINGFGSSSNCGGVPSSTSISSGIGPSNTCSKYSSYNTPIHSRTPSTGIPATPCNEEVGGKLGETNSLAGTAPELKSSFEVDGLTSLHCEVQSRLSFIVSGFRSQVETLQRDLQLTRLALIKQVGHKCTHLSADHQYDTVSLSDSLCSGEHQSVGQESNSSEISWENVDEKDTRPPLWLPDYAVSQCMGCDSNFWMGRRKHHCRGCGKIFCADCSDNSMLIPAEQIFKPVRVCRSCFNKLGKSSSEVSVTEDLTLSTNSNSNPKVLPTVQPKTTSSVPSHVDLLNTAAAHSQESTTTPMFHNSWMTNAHGTTTTNIRSKLEPEPTRQVLSNGNVSHPPLS